MNPKKLRSSRIGAFMALIALSACSLMVMPSLSVSAQAPAAGSTTGPTEAVSEENIAGDGEAAQDDALTAHPWEWISFDGAAVDFEVEAPESYVLTFNDDGTVEIVADCNRAEGIYEVEGDNISIAIGPMTLAYCPPDSRSDQFIRMLGSASSYSFEDGKLFINLLEDGGTMAFAPAGEDGSAGENEAALKDGLTATPWLWSAFVGSSEQFLVEAPESYVLTFNDDGTVEIVADCNNAAGTYEIDGDNLSIEIGPSTLAFCPPGSLSDQFIAMLGNVTRYSFEDGNLFINLMDDGGTMAFVPAAKDDSADEAEVALEDALTATPWVWSIFVGSSEQFLVDAPESYVLTFNASGTVEIVADCNLAGGTYEVDGHNLSIEIGPMTRAFCPPESRSDQFVAMLASAEEFVIAEGRLLIELKEEGGIMFFNPDVTTAVDLSEETALTIDEAEGTPDQG